MIIGNKCIQLTGILLCTILSGCSDTNENIPLEPPPETKIEFTLDVPEENKKEIDVINIQLQTLIDSNRKSKKEINARLTAIETRIDAIIIQVEGNTSIYEDLKKQIESLTAKVTSYFKVKVASKKKHKLKNRKRQVATKPPYKVIGIDQWGSFKYVQLIDSKGKLWLLRKGESIDSWKVSQVNEEGVTLVNLKGHTLALNLAL